ncbi:MAG: hypothetical protein FWF95_03970, partial [Syntrophorhabdaceae bacterium]|nr:hypothetical protein [Syntrophorhabdaceae bacterium]
MPYNSFNQIKGLRSLLNRLNLKLRPKLILIFLAIMAIPILLLTAIALKQIASLGNMLSNIAVTDSAKALNDSARENIERMTTDTSIAIAKFLYQRDQDILLLANLPPSDKAYKAFSESRNRKITKQGEWVLAKDGKSWVEKEPFKYDGPTDVSSNKENNDIMHKSSFQYRAPDFLEQFHGSIPLYDEVTFIDLRGNELYKYTSPHSSKKNYPLNPKKVNVSNKANTYIKAENYFEELKKLKPGEIYVSDVIGAYVGTNYIGMYAPGVFLNDVPKTHPNYDLLQKIGNLPPEEFIEIAKKQAYAGEENPVGQRFEGIIRWATPVTKNNGKIIGYATIALNHNHIMTFVDHITPMNKRYITIPNAYDGNYAFIWDYKCRNICHPRHHSIIGYNPFTGEPQTPWLEGTPDADTGAPKTGTPFQVWYDAGGAKWLEDNPAWDNLSKESEGTSWGAFYEANKDNRSILPQFGEKIINTNTGEKDRQSRSKKPAGKLTKAGFVGLDGRYLNNAPQCTGWMDLTESGGSGSFYILWSGIYKPTTAGAIPYYTGKYSPENQNGSRRGFAFVTIGSGIEDFTAPARDTEKKLTKAIDSTLLTYAIKLVATSIVLFVLIILIAIILSSYLTDNINLMLRGISRFRMGERQFRLRSNIKDEFGVLADSFDEMADSIVDSVTEPLSIIDMNHKIIYMNNTALQVIGKTLDQVVGTSYNNISIYPSGSSFDPITALHEGRET